MALGLLGGDLAILFGKIIAAFGFNTPHSTASFVEFISPLILKFNN